MVLINPYIAPFKPINNITPFTYRDGVTYLEILETLANYVQGPLTQYVNDNVTNLGNEFEIEVNKLITDLNLALAEQDLSIDSKIAAFEVFVTESEAALNAIIESQTGYVEGEIASLTAYVNAQVASILEASIEVSEDVIETVLANPSSTARATLDANYADKDIETIVTTGRLTEANLDAAYADKSVETIVTTGRLTSDSLEANFITRAEFDDSGVELSQNNVKLFSGPVGSRVTLPMHVGTGSQVVHPDVYFNAEGWNGYSYWMLYTPYPDGNDAHEDPCLAVSNDGINWIQAPGAPFPLDDAPGGTLYNSDTDISLGPDNTMYAVWRTTDTVAAVDSIYMRSSTDGVNWTGKQLIYSSPFATRRLVSPALIYSNGGWDMWAVDIVPATNTLVKLRSNGSAITSGFGAPTVCTVGALQAGKEAWHVDVIKHQGLYVGILADTNTGTSGVAGDLNLITSKDGLTWEVSNAIIPRAQAGQHTLLYRATLIPTYDESGSLAFRVWYSGVNGTTWGVFRTSISANNRVKKAIKGRTTAATIANGATTTLDVVFPVGMFTEAPQMFVGSTSSRITAGFDLLTNTGFRLVLSNWSGASAASVIGHWTAMEIG